MATAQVCPVVGTTNNILPPDHPEIKDGKTCPVTNATVEHHTNLQKHPSVDIPSGASPNDASACPALKTIIKENPIAKKTDEDVCPVVGTATTVLPPDHPSTKDAKDGAECPVTKAKIEHHKGKVHEHPSVKNAPEGAVCPVVGAKA